MSKETVHREPNKFSKSVGAGMKSVFGGGGKTYYVIEHKSASQNYRAGETQEIIIDYIEIGRDPKCQVSFGDTFPTVSRRHAAITKEGTSWVIRRLSEKNPLLLNGKAVDKQWHLQNGDEIQLSYEGPKLCFLVPNNNVVGSIGFTKRMSLFRQQALRPYKQAITAMSIFFLIAVGVLGFFIFDLGKKNAELAEHVRITKQQADSLKAANSGNSALIDSMRIKIASLNEAILRRPPGTGGTQTPPPEPDSTIVTICKSFHKNIYLVDIDKIEIQYQGTTNVIARPTEEKQFISEGTGFLLTDGRFITVRHVIFPWLFISPNDIDMKTPMGVLNLIHNNGGSVVAHFTAYSPNGGDKIQFKSTDFTANHTLDMMNVAPNGMVWSRADLSSNDKDWALYQTQQSGSIPFDNTLSQNLVEQTELIIIGYPLGMEVQNSFRTLKTLTSKTAVARDGLFNGLIVVMDRNVEEGSSGGPVFALKNGQPVVVGIVSAGVAETFGLFVPIGACQN